MNYAVRIIESGRHGLNGQEAAISITEVRGRTYCELRPEQGLPLVWIAVGWSIKGLIITIQGPHTLWKMEVV